MGHGSITSLCDLWIHPYNNNLPMFTHFVAWLSLRGVVLQNMHILCTEFKPNFKHLIYFNFSGRPSQSFNVLCKAKKVSGSQKIYWSCHLSYIALHYQEIFPGSYINRLKILFSSPWNRSQEHSDMLSICSNAKQDLYDFHGQNNKDNWHANLHRGLQCHSNSRVRL